MPKSYAEQKKKKDEEKVVGQQQKTQPAANKPIGSTSIPKSRTQSSAASSSRAKNLDTSGRSTSAKEQARKDRAKKYVERNPSARNYTNDTRTRRSELRTTKQRNEDERKEKRLNLPGYSASQYGKNSNWTPTRQKMAEVAQSNTRNNINNYSLGNGQTIGGGTISRIPDASNLPMIGGINQINDLDKYKINGQFDANSGVIDSRERAEKELENILYNRDAIREANRKDASVFNSLVSGIGYKALDTLGNMASLGEKMTTRNPLSTEGMTPDEIYNRAMESGNKINPFNYNANDIAGDYNAYREYVLSQMESGAVTPDEIQKMKDLETQYSKIPAKRLKEMGLNAQAVNEGLSEGHPIANVAGQMVPMIAGNALIGQTGIVDDLVNAASGINNPAARFAATQAANLVPDLLVDTAPEALANIAQGKSAGEVGADAVKNIAINELANLGFEYGPQFLKGMANKINSSNIAKKTAENVVPEVNNAISNVAKQADDIAEQSAKNVVPEVTEQAIREEAQEAAEQAVEAIQPQVRMNPSVREVLSRDINKLENVTRQNPNFNTDAYVDLITAVDNGDPEAILAATKQFDDVAKASNLTGHEALLNDINKYATLNSGISDVAFNSTLDLALDIDKGLDRIARLDTSALSEAQAKKLSDEIVNAKALLEDYKNAAFAGESVEDIGKEIDKTLGRIQTQASKLDGYDNVFENGFKKFDTVRGRLYGNSDYFPKGESKSNLSPEDQDLILDEMKQADALREQNRFARPANQYENVFPKAKTPHDVLDSIPQENGFTPSRYTHSGGIIPYDNKEIVNLTSSNHVINDGENIIDFINKSVGGKSADRFYAGKISDELADDIRNAIGKEYKNYNITLNEDRVRHIFKEHGKEATEAPRGQLAVTPDRLSKIMAVFDNPDSIVKSSVKDYAGRDAIEFSKRVDGTYYTVVGISDGRKNLDIDNLYIRKSRTSTANGNSTPSQRPNTHTGQALSDSNVANSMSSVNARDIAANTNETIQNIGKNTVPSNEGLPYADTNVPIAGEVPKSETEKLWEELSGGSDTSKTISESNSIPQMEGGAAEPKIRQGRTNVFERSGITEEESKNIFKPEDYSYVPDTNPDQLIRGAEIANSPDFKSKYIDNFDPESRYSVDEIDAMMMQSRKYRDLAREATDPIEKQKNYALSKQLSMNSVKAVGDNAASLQGWQKWVDTPEHVVDKGYGVLNDITEKYLKNNKKAAYGIHDVADKINKAMMDKGYADIIDSGDATKIAQLKNDLSNTIDEILGKADKNTRKALKGMTEAEIDDLIYNRSVNEINRALEFHAATGSTGIKDSTLDEIFDIMAKNEDLNPNSKEFVKNEQKIYSLIANDISRGKPFADKLDAWRYMAMLSSPATHLRNVSGNLSMRGLAGVKNNLAALIEAGADRVSKNGIDRTKSVLGVGDRGLVEAARKDALEHSYRALSGNMYTGMKSGIEGNMNVFNDNRFAGKALNKTNDFISGALSFEDELTKIDTYSTALAGYIKANGLDASILSPDDALSAKNIDQLEKIFSKGTKRLEYPTITDSPEKMWSQFMEDARAYAVNQAKVQTFNNTNEFAAPFSKFTKNLRGSDKAAVRGIGLAMDVTVPFKNVPANVLQTSFAYSPAEIAKVAMDIPKLLKGTISATDFIDDIAKTTTGTIGMIIGGLLARQGILKVSAGKGTKEKNFDKATDNMNDSISVGGHLVKLTQLFPAASPLIYGAIIYEAYANRDSEDEAIDTLVNGLGAIADGVVDMTFLQGLSDLFDAVKYAEDEKSKVAALGMQIGSNLAGQFVPTVGGLIEKGLDSTSRETYYTENSGIAQKAMQAIKYNLTKLPGSQKLGETLEKSSNSTISSLGDFLSLEPRIDSKGNVVEQKGGNAAGRLFRGTFPFELGEDRSTEIDNKLRDLAYSFPAGDSRDNVFPYTASSEAKFKNSADENVQLTEKQWTAYKQAKGQMTDAMIQELLGGTYDSLDNTAKVDILADLYKFATKYNQNAIGDGKLEGAMAKMAEVYDKEGIAGVVRNYAMEYMPEEQKAEVIDSLGGEEKQNAYQTMFGEKKAAQAVYDRALEIVGADSLPTAYNYYTEADLDGNGKIRQDEAEEFLNSQKDLTNQQRADYWDVLTGGKKNPFKSTGTKTTENETKAPEVATKPSTSKASKSNNLNASAANINKKEALRQKNAEPVENTTQDNAEQENNSVPELGWSVSNGSKTYDLHDTKGYQKASAAGISDDEWLQAYWAANTDRNAHVTKGEVEAYIKALGDISQDDKRAWFDYLIGTKAKNPY